MPLLIPLGFAQLLAHLTPDQVRIAAEFHYDRRTQQEIADRRGISQASVCRSLAAFEETCKLYKCPVPDHSREPDTRHVRTISESLMRSL
jgi:hypothetical protein